MNRRQLYKTHLFDVMALAEMGFDEALKELERRTRKLPKRKDNNCLSTKKYES